MKGFILVYTIIILLVVAIVSFTAMQMMFEKTRSFYLHNQQMMAWRETNKNLLRIENSLKNKSYHCQIAVATPDEVAHQPLSFWQNRACHEMSQLSSYYFVLEFLGHQACGKIANQLGVDFIRISMLAILKSKVSNFLLQRTIAIPSKKTSTCKENIISLNPGVQSRRELFWTG